MEKSEGGDFPPKRSQSEVASIVNAPPLLASADVPQKKLARQLDFTSFSGGGGDAGATAAIFPEHHTQIQQPVVKPSQSPRPQLQPQLVVKPSHHPRPQLQLQQHIVLMPMQQPAAPPHIPSMRPMKPESPRARPRQSATEVKDCTPKKQKQCNCKHSRCLKLYCECFASGIYCDGCNCVNCFNNVENEAARREAVEATLDRNPNAFRPKIASSPHGVRDNRVLSQLKIKEEAGDGLILGKHNKGCHCKKSGCLKKYCECFQANILCSDNCKCMDCKNFEGSEERQALFHGDHSNTMSYLQQAANAAITGAVGASGFGSPPVSKKRKGQELLFGSTMKNQVNTFGQFPQTNHIKPSIPSSSMSSISNARVSNPAAMGPSKFTYRSLLADMVQPLDVKELCSVLVYSSRQAAKLLAEEKNARENQREASVASLSQEQLENKKDLVGNAWPSNCSSGTGKPSLDSADVSTERPMSPGTLALMCDEQNTVFAAASPNESTSLCCNTSSQLSHGKAMPEAYAEQERIVLSKFRDCLNRLITLGEIKETKCSSMARASDSVSQKGIINNGTQQEAYSNGVAMSTVPPPTRISQPVSSTVGGVSSPLHVLSQAAENGIQKPKN